MLYIVNLIVFFKASVYLPFSYMSILASFPSVGFFFSIYIQLGMYLKGIA